MSIKLTFSDISFSEIFLMIKWFVSFSVPFFPPLRVGLQFFTVLLIFSFLLWTNFSSQFSRHAHRVIRYCTEQLLVCYRWFSKVWMIILRNIERHCQHFGQNLPGLHAFWCFFFKIRFAGENGTGPTILLGQGLMDLSNGPWRTIMFAFHNQCLSRNIHG